MEGFSFEVATLAESRRAVTALAAIPRVLRLSAGFDLVHVHGDTASILCTPLLRRRASVITLHGMHLIRRWHGPRGFVAKRRLRAAMEGADATICVSEAEFVELTQFSGRARLERVPNGIPLSPLPSAAERQRARADLGLGADDLAVLFAASLDPHKDPLTFARAVEAARERGAPVIGLIAGDGPQRSRLPADAAGVVRVLGQRDELHDLLIAADAFVNASLREGLSLAVLEAMDMALVPVVSNGPGNPEAVGETGLVFPCGDAEALAEALVRVSADRDWARHLGTQARQRAERLYDVRRMVAQTREVYERVLNRSEPLRPHRDPRNT
jgi:glycosyltransferase involved in cell wall biosynthesis